MTDFSWPIFFFCRKLPDLSPHTYWMWMEMEELVQFFGFFFLFLPEPCQLICFHLKADVGTLPRQQFYKVPYNAVTRCDECNQLRRWWQATRSCIPRQLKEAASAFLLDYPRPFISIREQMSCRAARRSAQTNGEWVSVLQRELLSRRGHWCYIVHRQGYWWINKLDAN